LGHGGMMRRCARAFKCGATRRADEVPAFLLPSLQKLQGPGTLSGYSEAGFRPASGKSFH
jgi:hypothetical protein